MHGNCSTNQRSRNGGMSVKHDQKLTWPGEAHNEFAHQIWTKSNQQFAIWTETAQPIKRPGKGKNSVERDPKLIQLREAHNGLALQIWAQSDWVYVHGNWLTNQIVGNDRNSGKRDHDQGLNRLQEACNEFSHQIWAQSDQRFFLEICRNCSTTQEARKPWQKLIWSGEYYNECIHHVSDWSTEQFVRKCMETARPIVIRSWNSAEHHLQLMRSGEYIHLRWIPWAVCPKMHGNHQSVTDDQTDGQAHFHSSDPNFVPKVNWGPRWNSHHFADISKFIFFNEHCILI